MRNPLASETSTNLGIFVARLALGASLLMAGYAQFSGGVGVFAASATSAGNLPRWMPGEASVAYSRCLPFIEMAAGGMLVLGGSSITASGIPASPVVGWNGAAYVSLGAGLGGSVTSLATLANGDLIAGGSLWLGAQPPAPATSHARRANATWSSLSPLKS